MSEANETKPPSTSATAAGPARPPTGDGAREAARRSATLRRWLRRGVVVLVLLALAATLLLALEPQPVPVDVATVDRGAIELVVDEPGRARVIDRYVVSAPLSGNVARVELHASDSVEAGAVVARIVPLASPLLDARTRTEAEARLAEARARREQARFSITHARELLAFAESEAGRQRQLAAGGSIAPRDLERAEMEERTRRNEITSLEFGLRVAEHEVRLAEASLGRLAGAGRGAVRAAPSIDSVEVTSPVAGMVLRVVRENAGVIQAGEAILEIGDPAALEIVTDVLTSDAVRIAPGARVRIDDWGGDPLEGRVRLIEPSATTRVSALGVEEQRVDVVVTLESPREVWRALGDGYRVETHITVERREGATRAPTSALFRTGEGWSAYVIEGANVRLRAVETGLWSRDVVEIVAGLAEGDRVVVYPGERVVDGVEVTVRD
jgi:HlyD family secretion protein